MNAIQYIARYIRLVKRHGALLAIHASSTRGSDYAFIGVATKQRFVRFKLRCSYVVMESSRNIIIDFDSVNLILLTEKCADTYKSKVFNQDVRQFGTADKTKLYDAIGATVVAPSDFQIRKTPNVDNQ